MSDTSQISAPAPRGAQYDSDIGARFNPLVQPQTDDPYPVLADARSAEPVFYSDALDAWIVTRYQTVQEVLQDTETFLSGGLDAIRPLSEEVKTILAERPPTVPMLISVDAPVHTRRRKITQTGVSPKRISALQPRIREIAHGLIDQFYDQGECDFYQAFAFRFPLAVISSLLGFPESAAEKLHFWASCRVMLAWGDLDEEMGRKVARGIVDFHRFIEAETLKRESEPMDDLISDMVLLNKQGGNLLSLAEIVEEVHGLLTAGHETTANWITMTLYRLLRDQTDWKKICSDQSLIPGMLEEALRFDGPVIGVWRKVANDVNLDGASIRKGDRVFCALGSANRDSDKFVNGESFSIERKDAKQRVMFGRGPHTCVGASLARLEGRIGFEVIIERLAHARLAQSRLSFSPNTTLRLPQALRLEWDV